MPLHYRHGFHSRLADLNRPLRYFLGGIRPKQTAHQILSLYVFTVVVSVCHKTEWYLTDESNITEIIFSTSPTYATQLHNIHNTKLQ